MLTKSTTKADDRLIANPSTRLFPRFDDMQQQTSTLRLPVQGGGDRELILLHGNAAGAPEYPQLSAREWGSDDYDAESESKVHEGPLIRWVDVPSVGTRGRRKVDDKNRFLAFVGSDAGGYCWCEFTVERVWEQSGGTGGPGYKLVDGLRCP
ncbi:MAG: hypothetical protein HY574_08445 [candidate division NC10 bacterium]|nr:hypothetical protein [candidate division NC10 bacterium]